MPNNARTEKCVFRALRIGSEVYWPLLAPLRVCVCVCVFVQLH